MFNFALQLSEEVDCQSYKYMLSFNRCFALKDQSLPLYPNSITSFTVEELFEVLGQDMHISALDLIFVTPVFIMLLQICLLALEVVSRG